jgi:hypothetical protein
MSLKKGVRSKYTWVNAWIWAICVLSASFTSEKAGVKNKHSNDDRLNTHFVPSECRLSLEFLVKNNIPPFNDVQAVHGFNPSPC